MPVAVPVAVPQTKALLDSLRGAGADVDHTKIFAEHGFNKLHFAFDPKYIPWINPMLVAPQDLLHTFPDGLLRSECAWLFYILLKLGLKISDANERLRSFKGFTRGVRVPPFQEKLKEGAIGGVHCCCEPAVDEALEATKFSAEPAEPSSKARRRRAR